MGFLEPGAPVRSWLRGPAALYGAVVKAKMWAYDRGWRQPVRLPCRVISLGNMTVGGTGKTPMVIMLAEWLQARGQRVAVLSRGYKRTSTAAQVLVSDGRSVLAGPDEAGDEPYLIARRCPGVVVAVGADRAALGRWVLQQHPVDCVILDDGFQHRAVARDCDLVLVDAMDATGLDAVVPAGRLREPLSGMHRATAVIITRAETPHEVSAVRSRLTAVFPSDVPAIEVRFLADALVSVSGQARQALEWAVGKRVWLVSGIGNSQAFRRLAMDLGMQVLGETVYRDHHAYEVEEITRIRTQCARSGAELVVTTEKDAGKLATCVTAEDPWWAVRIRADVVRGEAALRRLILGEEHKAR